MYCYIHEDTGPSNSLRSTIRNRTDTTQRLPDQVQVLNQGHLARALRNCFALPYLRNLFPIYSFQRTQSTRRLCTFVHTSSVTYPDYEGMAFLVKLEILTMTIQLRIAQ